MTKLVTWTVINNEIDFIADLLDYHLSWVDAMYFLDTGSTDGTLPYLQQRAQTDSRLVVEEYPVKYVPQYDVEWRQMTNPFPEVIIRNHALQRVEELLQPDWLIQLDGDEVFLSGTKDIIAQNSDAIAIGHATINPVASLQVHPLEKRGGYLLHDPHVRLWRTNQGINYINNPVFGTQQFHCIPIAPISGRHLFHHPLTKFVDVPIHFHLHWMYGKKLEIFFQRKKILDKSAIIAGQMRNQYAELLPQIFWERRIEWVNI